MLISYNSFPLTLLSLLVLSIKFRLVDSLRMIMFDIPSQVYAGDSVELSCSFDLEKDRLYSVKFYKNDIEFYRYVPKDWNKVQFLPLKGLKVDLNRSGTNKVYLRQVELSSAGVYRCEVSAEAPSFKTADMVKKMDVLVVPMEEPKITGSCKFYKPGDTVSLNCTSAKSKPAAILHWHINGKQVGGEYEVLHSTTWYQQELIVTSSHLKFIVNDKNFVHNRMRIKCTATISRVHKTSNEIIALKKGHDDDNYLVPVLQVSENLSQVRDGSSSLIESKSNLILALMAILYMFLNGDHT